MNSAFGFVIKGRILILSGIFGALICAALFLLLSSGAWQDGQVALTLNARWLHTLTFALASMLVVPALSILVIFAFFYFPERQDITLDLLGIFFAGIAVVAYAVAMISQFSLLYRRLGSVVVSGSQPARATEWLISEGVSIPLFLVMTSSLFFAIALVAIGWKFITARGIERGVGISMFLLAIVLFCTFVFYSSGHVFSRGLILGIISLSLLFSSLIAVMGYRVVKEGSGI